MAELLRLLWEICCFRKGPQDVPYAPHLAGALVVAAVAVEATGLYFAGTVPVASSPVAMTFWLGTLYGLLAATGHANRYVQTLSAFAGVDLIVSCGVIPLQLALSGVQKGATLTPAQALTALLLLTFYVWHAVIIAHILRHAMSLPFLATIFISFASIVAQLFVVGLVIGH